MQQDETQNKEGAVTIGLTVLLDEVPHEVARLLGDLSAVMNNTSARISAAAQNFDVTDGEIDFLSNYQDLIKCKSAIDRNKTRLHDILLILTDFYKQKMEEAQGLSVVVPEDEDSTDVVVEADEGVATEEGTDE